MNKNENYALGGSMDDSNGKYSSASTHKLSSKGLCGHVAGMLKHWIIGCTAFTGLLVATFGFIEVTTKLVGITPSYPKIAPYVILVCGMFAMWRIVVAYVKDIPDYLAHESRNVRKTYFWQRPGWQFRLALALLEDRLRKLDVIMDNVTDGSKYIPGHKVELQEYIKWMCNRPENVQRLLHAACKTMLEKFPLSLQNGKEKIDAQMIVLLVEQIACIYQQSIIFEEDAKAIVPCEGFEDIHPLTLGWTTPIREAIKELLVFLRKAGYIDYRSIHTIDFFIKIDAPPQVSRFSGELKKLSARISP